MGVWCDPKWLAASTATAWHLSVHPQMGMGKTACAVGAIQLNPPPADWRKNRSYQSLRAQDHLCKCHLRARRSAAGLCNLGRVTASQAPPF